MENNSNFHTTAGKRYSSVIPQTSKDELTFTTGVAYKKSIIDAVWEKAQKVIDFHFFKFDAYGNTIEKHEYECKTKYGWVIELIIPESEGGTYDLENLRPVHWKHYKKKGDQ